jgi:drug/metabolite transporter (DMT)-like permease
VQNIYLAIAGGLVLAATIPIIVELTRRYGMADVRVQVLVAGIAGMMGAVLITSLRSDLVPDELESVLAAIVLGVGSLAVGWLAWHGLRTR